MSVQWIYGSSLTQLSTGSVEYIAVLGGGTLQSTHPRARIPWAAAGKFTELHVWLTTAPGSGKSRTIEVRAGTGAGSTAYRSVTISNTDTSGSDTSAASAISEADEVFIALTPTGTPAAAYLRWAVKWEPTTAGEHIVGGITETTELSTSATQYLSTGGGAPAPYSLETYAHMYPPVPGTAYNFYAHLTIEPGVGNKDRRFTLRKNGANVSATIFLIAESNTVGNETSSSTAIAVGDYITYGSSLADFGSPAPNASHVGYSFVYKATDTDYYLICHNGDSVLPTGTNTRYRRAQTGGGVWDAATTGRLTTSRAMYVDRAYMWVSNTPTSPGYWSTGWDNIIHAPGHNWYSISAPGALVVSPVLVPADRTFCALVYAGSVVDAPPDNKTVLSACYACKDSALAPTRSAPFMF